MTLLCHTVNEVPGEDVQVGRWCDYTGEWPRGGLLVLLT
jgi:hypothetical protein